MHEGHKVSESIYSCFFAALSCCSSPALCVTFLGGHPGIPVVRRVGDFFVAALFAFPLRPLRYVLMEGLKDLRVLRVTFVFFVLPKVTTPTKDARRPQSF